MEFPEDANMWPSKGALHPLEALLILVLGLFSFQHLIRRLIRLGRRPAISFVFWESTAEDPLLTASPAYSTWKIWPSVC